MLIDRYKGAHKLRFVLLGTISQRNLEQTVDVNQLQCLVKWATFTISHKSVKWASCSALS